MSSAIQRNRAISARFEAIEQNSNIEADLMEQFKCDDDLLECPRCERANIGEAIGGGFCAWCGFNSPYEAMMKGALQEMNDPQVLAELFGE